MSKLLQRYLKFWARKYLKRAKPKIVAITGSVGKTSTKEAIFEVLKIKYGRDIRKAEGNLNNETGVPVAVLDFKKAPSHSATNFFGWIPIIISAPFKSFLIRKIKILVLELAADKPGDIKYLTSFIKPNIACITSIGPAHLEAFGTIDKIVEEKTELLRSLPSEGWAVLNIDDENLKKVSYDGRWLTLTYSIDQQADIMAKNITTEIMDFKPLTKLQVLNEQGKFRAEIFTLGRAWNVYSALAGVAVGNIFEMSAEDIISGLKNIRAEKHRMTVVEGKRGTVIIDDSYNANPVSMKAALDVLKILPAKGKKIAVLGDMLEIGKITNEAHKLIGEYAQEIAAETIAVGELAKLYAADKYFKDKNEAIEYLLSKIKEGDIILIKASRGVGLEEIVEAFKEGT